MNRKIFLGLVVVIIILGIAGGIKEIWFTSTGNHSATEETHLYTCPMHPEVITEEPGQCPKCGMDLVPVKKNAGVQEKEHQYEEEEPQLWTCGMHPEVLLEEPGQCPKCGMNLVPVKKETALQEGKTRGKGKILYWQAPMDPTEIYDHPGKSKMGMDLIPVYENDVRAGAGGVITIDPATVQNMGVRTATVQKQDFNRTIRTVGIVKYDESKLFTVNSRISGWIEKLYVDYTGEMVQSGQPLLEIYSPELVTTQQEYLLALQNLKSVQGASFASLQEGAQSLLKAARKRLDYWNIPPSEIQRLEKTGKVRKTLPLHSPYRGVVVHKNAVEGAYVKEGSNLYQIADLSTVWVLASIYDNELPWIREGQAAEMELTYLPGKRFQGKIRYIYPYLNEKARDVQVRLEFPNPNLELKPGMYANVFLKGKTIPDALVIPVEAVIRSGKRDVVFVVREKGKFEPRQIRVGEEDGEGNIRVVSGLLEGETIVTSAQFLLDSESRLQEAIQKMLEEKKKQKKTSSPKAAEEKKSTSGKKLKKQAE